MILRARARRRVSAILLLAAPALAACGDTHATAPTAPAVRPALNVFSGKALTASLGSADPRWALVASATAEISVHRGSGQVCYRLTATTAQPSVEFAWHSVVTLSGEGVGVHLANEPTKIGPLVDGAASHLAEGCSIPAQLTAEDLRRITRNPSAYTVTATYTVGSTALQYSTGEAGGLLGGARGK